MYSCLVLYVLIVSKIVETGIENNTEQPMTHLIK